MRRRQVSQGYKNRFCCAGESIVMNKCLPKSVTVADSDVNPAFTIRNLVNPAFTIWNRPPGLHPLFILGSGLPLQAAIKPVASMRITDYKLTFCCGTSAHTSSVYV